MNSSGTTAGFQAQILWSKESAALFRICLQIWILKTRAQTTDTPDNVHGEGGEEESMTNDEMVTHGSPGNLQALLDHMRADQNIALAGERFNEANQIQQAIIALLDASAGENPEGLS